MAFALPISCTNHNKSYTTLVPAKPKCLCNSPASIERHVGLVFAALCKNSVVGAGAVALAIAEVKAAVTRRPRTFAFHPVLHDDNADFIGLQAGEGGIGHGAILAVPLVLSFPA